MDKNKLGQTAITKLSQIIDPETGIDVVRMKLVQDIQIDENGKLSCIFRPSSPLCPIAVPLAIAIINTIKEIPGISEKEVTVVDYVQAEILNDLLKTIT